MALVDFVFLYSMARKAKLLLDESMLFNLVETQQPIAKGTCRRHCLVSYSAPL